ncbi:MAG: phosphoribosylformylglycinamidine synthase subunit PurL [Candidatus Cloacimonetes bacterium]|jgi:phosphoribosylformylglycinamidine synthase|nr:phosphoribosylformylglycinamidine synthase subunit PurL [Candidatus Cloacimonadota bacterium]MDD2422953.1 phosphoribosylformylglycinamidine synthase subunit PurL [Candidatus Cloacimonadota bacterium]MDD4276922.1 phosphoribosylformylglycinamidine synthase subunit PurL [Candidatus Cloacimonadota bacterium]MDY0324916.1 phosphoribosylformylglycinamidine synthase subunit PurL [Candidatus Cloacimonadaceae bacterium]
MQITDQIIAEHGISKQEYQYILEILGREPKLVELGIFSVMWSEHASYKNSILQLKTLPKEGKMMLTETGEENAGVVDIGDNLAISFKIESHNHPSALEPYHGAATGVGGILRDIFTMGARPIAALNSLRFGNPQNPVVKHLLSEVVRGIADYGNCFGVPTVGGEIYFEDSYEGNPLVNAMAIGLLKHEDLAKSAAAGVGNAVIIVGAKTGRDGIHGATFASIELSEESEEKRTAVQVGDPFYEKLLLEATLEIIYAGLVVGIQDMGAAGLTCSSSEMAGKGGVGIEIDVSKVPQRESGMTTYEIMLSESQERMLVIVEPHNIAKVLSIFGKWDLDAVQIGTITDDKILRVKNQGVVEAEIPAEYLILGGKAPVYTRESKRPEYLDVLQNEDLSQLNMNHDLNEVLIKLLACPNIASKRNVFSQYDHMVGISTTVEPGSDAAVIRIRESDKAIAASTDCNGRYCYLDPYEGTKAAVAEAARNVACSGAQPIAISNCLNFGNPYKPEVYYGFTECIRGMKDACLAFNTPVTGGNVSFYNESPEGAIYPTPVIAMLGLMQDFRGAQTQYFKAAGDKVFLLGPLTKSIGGSEYLKVIHHKIAGLPPRIDLALEKRVQDTVLELNEAGLTHSAHDLSEGGLAIALAECCFHPEQTFGFKGKFSHAQAAALCYFGESGANVIISAAPEHQAAIQALAQKHQVELHELGEVTKAQSFTINDNIDVCTLKLRAAYETGITL